jgi:hypothetical protein
MSSGLHAAMWIFHRYARADLPPARCSTVRKHKAILSLRPLLNAGWLRASGRTLPRGAAIAAPIYAAMFLLHEPVIGVTPKPA